MAKRVSQYTTELVKEDLAEYSSGYKRKMQSPDDIQQFIKDHFYDMEAIKNKIGFLSLSTKLEVLGIHTFSKDLDAQELHKELFRKVILNNADAIIGFKWEEICMISREERQTVEYLHNVSQLVGITLVDFVVSEGNIRFISFKDKGYLLTNK